MNSLLVRRRSATVLALLAGLSLSVDVGCGRATLGDPYAFTSSTSGNGGAGGATGSTTNTSTNDTTSTGGTCDCVAFCAALDPCGFGSADCVDVCNQGLDPDLMQCACDAGDCDQLVECANTSGPSTATVATSTGTGGGGGFSPACADCANESIEMACVNEINQCGVNNDCIDILDCMAQCGYGVGCEAQCVMGSPAGVSAFYNLIGCAICDFCAGPCATSDVFLLCAP